MTNTCPIVHSNPDAVAYNARLCYFKHGAADSVPVSVTDLVIGKAIECEFFPNWPNSKSFRPR